LYWWHDWLVSKKVWGGEIGHAYVHYIYIYICICVCICICMYVYVDVDVYIHFQAFTCVYVYVCVNLYVYVSVYVYVYVYAYVHVYVNMYMYTFRPLPAARPCIENIHPKNNRNRQIKASIQMNHLYVRHDSLVSAHMWEGEQENTPPKTRK